MSYYKPETWSLREVAKAFKTPATDTENPRIIVPVFQRGLRWKKEKRNKFIDSLTQGFPFGALLFAKQSENEYAVVDGLQRGSTICDYYYNPLNEFNLIKIDDKVLDDIRQTLFPGNENHTINDTIGDIILTFLHEKKTYDNVDLFELSRKIFEDIPNQEDPLSTVTKIHASLKPYINENKEIYDSICDASVPVVVYSGPNEHMSEIFRRINVDGIPLNDYEIYAAIWQQGKKIINSQEVVQKVVDKYMVLLQDDYSIDDFSAQDMLTTKELTTFEFLFGLGKYWYEIFDCLKTGSGTEDDVVNEVSFEIVDACLNDNKDIANLDKILFKKYNANKLQRRIEEAILFVEESIAMVSQFKGNQRKNTVLHPKYQIISLISYVFREMYDPNNLEQHRSDWNSKKSHLADQLLAHYVADILANEWHDGGAGKVYSTNREKRYNETITKERWESLLDSYYQEQLAKKQKKNFSSPTNADSVILNCVYTNIFTAGDQLSGKKFDIEHLATKEKMRNLLKPLDLALPVGCIANQCYLPEDINRGKKEKTIYEAKGMSMTVTDIENKFSFTKQQDFDWIFKSYDTSNQTELEKAFITFLGNRYKEIKKRFLKLFGY